MKTLTYICQQLLATTVLLNMKTQMELDDTAPLMLSNLSPALTDDLSKRHQHSFMI